jgi:hypothetical protein
VKPHLLLGLLAWAAGVLTLVALLIGLRDVVPYGLGTTALVLVAAFVTLRRAGQ